jgi:beta-lactamase class A
VAPLEETVVRLIADAGAEAAVACRPLDAGPGAAGELLINPTARFHAASTMKVAVMVELYRRAHAGVLTLDDAMVVHNRFASLAGGEAFALSPADDSETALYASTGRPATLRHLCDVMITSSSNLATNNLIDALGVHAIQAALDDLGASGLRVLRRVEDQAAFDHGLNNTTDAAALLTLYWKLGRGEVVSRRASEEMIEILKRQQMKGGIPSGLPGGTIVAHKPGTLKDTHHDAGIVFAGRPYALVILVRGGIDATARARLIGEITKACQNARHD